MIMKGATPTIYESDVISGMDSSGWLRKRGRWAYDKGGLRYSNTKHLQTYFCGLDVPSLKLVGSAPQTPGLFYNLLGLIDITETLDHLVRVDRFGRLSSRCLV